jgi:hypothetical protein
MKTSIKNLLLVAAIAYVIEANVYCAGAVIAAAFIPLIGAADWKNADPTINDHYFFVDIDGEGANHAIIKSGNEFLNNTQFRFTGEYTDHRIKIKFDSDAGSRAGKSYEGNINDASNEMVLTSPDGLPATTLRKQ